MRDFLLVLIVLGSLPVIFVRPHVGILVWTWLSFMSPHRLTWGMAAELRVALIVGLATIIAWLLSRENKRLPSSVAVYVLFAFTIWVIVSTFFALVPEFAWQKLDQILKIIGMTLVAMCLMHGRSRIEQLTWITVLSLGFYGVRGGIFAILTGGNYRVFGPPDTFISDNNQLALALVMTLPLMRYCQIATRNSLVKHGMWGVIGLTLIAIIATYSRGGLLALGAMLGFLWLKTPHRLVTGSAMGAVLALALMFAPQSWYDRMASISNYKQDESVLGRFDAWTFAWRIALDRPLVGGGPRAFYDSELFLSYVPEAPQGRNAHSIYFEVLGETGFVGLGLFFLLGISAFWAASRVIRMTRNCPDLQWAKNLAAMTQVSMVGYATAGAFLNLGFFDLYYTIIAIIVLLYTEVQRSMVESMPRETRFKNSIIRRAVKGV